MASGLPVAALRLFSDCATSFRDCDGSDVPSLFCDVPEASSFRAVSAALPAPLAAKWRYTPMDTPASSAMTSAAQTSIAQMHATRVVEGIDRIFDRSRLTNPSSAVLPPVVCRVSAAASRAIRESVPSSDSGIGVFPESSSTNCPTVCWRALGSNAHARAITERVCAPTTVSSSSRRSYSESVG